MKLKVWTMKTGRTFDGDFFIFEARENQNLGQAIMAASDHCLKTRGYRPEQIERMT